VSNKATSSGSNENTVFVGSKPLVNYIRGVITQFMKRNAPEVVIKSRGKFISKAVDVAEVARRSLENSVKIKEVKIGSESFESEGRRTNISTMDITLIKN
jgi:DNA-binding protein